MALATPYALPPAEAQPMGEINTTPLIDVMLVLLIMFVVTIPLANHSLEVPLPSPTDKPPLDIRPSNELVLTASDQVLWNGGAISLAQLSHQLAVAARLPREPEIRFRPDGQSSYGLSAEVLRRIKASGLASFGLVGNEDFAGFGKPERR